MSSSSVESLIKKFATQTLQDCVKVQPSSESKEDRRNKTDEIATKEIRDLVKKRSEEYGIKSLLHVMTAEELAILYSPYAEVDPVTKEVKKRTRIGYIKKLNEEIATLGLNKYIAKLPADHAAVIESHVDLKISEFTQSLANMLREAGFEMFLRNDCPVATLQQLCDDHNINVQSKSPNVLIKAIMTGKKPVEKKKKKVVEIQFMKKKPQLKAGKGISYHDIFQHYYLEELQQYCRDIGIKISGSKPQIIRRILAHWEDPTTGFAKTSKKATPDKKGDDESDEESEDEVADSQAEDGEESDESDEEELVAVEEKTVQEKTPSKIATPTKKSVIKKKTSTGGK